MRLIGLAGLLVVVRVAPVRPLTMLGLLLFMLTTSAADDSLSALQQLQGLRSVTQAGLTIDEYRRRTLDAKVVVDRYVAAGASGPRAVAIQKAMENYLAASTAWGYSLYGSSTEQAWSASCLPALTWYTASYANAMQGMSGEGARDMNRLLNKAMIQIYWGCAGDYLADAESKPRAAWAVPEPLPPSAPAPKPAPPAQRPAKKGVAPECRTITEKDGTEVTICR